MNDTDKYDYENIQQWVVSGNTVLSVAPPENRIVASNLTIQDAQLIADAPLLLAEVKRLREQFKLAYDWVDYQLPDGGMRDFAKYIGDVIE
tara:strand:+ start:24987 stop:25259 length:273 start_codon:yes stop_codon:yes gene_type:complete